MKPDNEVLHAAHALALWTGGVLAEINKLARKVSELVESNLAGRPKVGESSLAGLKLLSQEFLAGNTFAVGAGTFFAARSVEAEGHIFEWWSRGQTGAISKLDADLTPGSNRYYDYEKLPFFSTAASTGEQTLWGPYIDYLGFEEYIITLTAPFSLHGSFAGVAGCDILVKDLERLIMPDLRAIPGDAALVNASNRVIMGNSGMYLVGERIKPGSPGDQQRMDLDVPHLGLSLVYGS